MARWGFDASTDGAVRLHTGRISRHSLFSTLFLFILFLSASLAQAQQNQPGIVGLGDLVVTGFSGTVAPPPGPPLPPGVNALDETFIDPDGASLKLFDVSSPGATPQAQLLNAPEKYKAFARDIGQVFGLALDKENPANIYAASTSVHGLQIVVADADGDGRPERIKLGQPGARWMEGQFGLARGGGPGTVWKIHGETGEISKFADILSNGVPNSGPGLGNIAYDQARKQLFVSDLDTGEIKRLDMTGAELETFDHGLQGRPANGLGAVQDDPASRADITSPAFDAEDPGSWGFTAPERRVWGLAVYRDRLYYAVEAGGQIWSVGIGPDGGFAGDPRWELDLPAAQNANPVSDIAFQPNGSMLLAQRGGIASRYDYSQYHTPRKSSVLRYRLESPDDPATPSRWVAEPEDYAIGFPGIHRNASGGIALGYGYRQNAGGNTVFGAPQGTLWTTGDALRDNPVHGAQLAQGGPLNVHGLQGNALNLVRPGNEPPWQSYFVDYDGKFDDPQASGHVGDVEIAHAHARKPVMDLRIHKRAIPELCTIGDQCTFEIEITNTGALTYSGPLVIRDVAHGGAQLIGHSPPDWDCREAFPGGGIYECKNPGVTLQPGEHISLELIFHMPPWWTRPVYDNCAELIVPGAGVDHRPYNNRSCDYVPTIETGHPLYAPDLQLEKFGLFGACDFFGLCEFVVRITNVGAAPYTGLLHINDVTTTAGATLIDWSPKPEWNCAAIGPGEYGCSTAGPVTLAPGDFREIIILVQGPPIAPGVTHVQNCANIDWKGLPHDPNPHNEFDCAELSNLPPWHPAARPKVTIQKDAAPTCSRPAPGNPWACAYKVRIKNSGSAPLIGPIKFTDTVTAHPATLLAFGGGPGAWNCVPGIGFAGPYTCTHPPVAGGLLPGSEVAILMSFKLPAGILVPSLETNTAIIKWDNDGDGVDEDHVAVAISLICDAGSANCQRDLAILKQPPAAACLKGSACQFSVTIQNLANVIYPGPVNVTDIPDPGAGPPNVLTPGWACAPAGGSYTCSNPAGILPGAVASFSLKFPIPPGYASPTFKNCAEVAPGPNNVFPFNDKDCATAVVPFADLAPWSPSSCTLGTDCTLDVQIDNKGHIPFIGSAGMRGTLRPAVRIKSITGKDGLSCKVTGKGTYECRGKLNIPSKGAAKLQMIVAIPAKFPHKKIVHTKTIFWPDRKVKDPNPKNDTHKSDIDILQPEKPATRPVVHKCPAGWTIVPASGAPAGWKVLAIDGIDPDGSKWGLMCMQPPPRPAGRPDLAVTKTANQGSCTAGARCSYTVVTTNAGSAPYTGEIRISDTISPANARLTSSGPSPWRCRRSRGSVLCTYPRTTLAPGQSKTLSLTFTLPRNAAGAARNCAALSWGPTSTRGSVREVQRALAAQGYNPGRADGRMGRNTRNAIRAYQRRLGQQPSGRIDQALLSSLFGQPGGGDANPRNDKSCAVSSILIPPPPRCTSGRFYDQNTKRCECPSSVPVWDGKRCIPRTVACTGGRFRNTSGMCVCPSSAPLWTGRICMPQVQVPPECAGGQVQSYVAGRIRCTCPANKPVWNGRNCTARPVGCTGGQIPSYVRGKIRCACPSNKPVWTGKICTAREPVRCTGGRISSASGACFCPQNKPTWTGRACIKFPTIYIPGGPAKPTCFGGRKLDKKGQCVCAANKIWDGQRCRRSTTQPPITGGPTQIGCSGGRIRSASGQCFCPPDKPVWTGKFCIPRLQQINPQGPVLRLPGGGTIKLR